MTRLFTTAFMLLFVTGISFAQQSNPFDAKRKTVQGQAQTQQMAPGMLQRVVPPAATVNSQTFTPLTFHTPNPQTTDLIEIIHSSEDGLPIFVRSNGASVAGRNLQSDAARTEVAYSLLEQLKSSIRVPDPRNAFTVKSIETDALGHTHLRLSQHVQQVPVYGAEVMVHITPQGELIFNGRNQPAPALSDVTPDVDLALAVTQAVADVSARTAWVDLSESWKSIMNYEAPTGELVIYRSESGSQRLTWHVTLLPNVVERWEYFVDAETGAILHYFNHTCTLGPTTGSGTDLGGVSRSLNIFLAPDGKNYLVDASRAMYQGPTNALPNTSTDKGFILTGDANNSGTANPNFTFISSNNANSWSNKGVSAHYNAGKAYEYFLAKFSRNSINGQGGSIFSFINVTEENGTGMDNAFWNGVAMFYGNGNQAFTPLAEALDVGGHEMSHGVVQETANLEYEGQSGALNESFADIFGVMIDRDDWLLGEDVVLTAAFPSGALRSMSDPHNGGSSLNDQGFQPRHMNEIYTGSQDNGGVHINSGIVNWAFFKFASAVGKDKAEQVYYRALNNYLTRSSQFIDCRVAVIQAASDIHGANSAEVTAAQNAFNEVGIGSGGGGTGGGGGGTGGQNYQYQLPVNPGPDFIVSSDTNPSDPNELYISSTTGTNFQALSTTTARKPMSVSDNGAVGYFVGTDNHIYGLYMNAGNPQQTQISNVAEWASVAISKDGNRLAAITTYEDTSIYVFNFATNPATAAKFTLYNPTTAQGGVNGGGVLYADALDWDHSGQYVLYDAFNRINNPLGSDLEYWDVGLINVWNKAGNTFGDGTVSKVFSDLPEGVNVGNAVFSKNSASIIAFDYFESTSGENYVLAANIESGATGTVFQNLNGILGFPSYSKLDNQMIFNAQNNQGGKIIGGIALQTDKITGSGSAFGVIGDAEYGVWYATGTRSLNVGVEEPSIKAGALMLQPNPFNSELLVSAEMLRTADVQIQLLDLVGRQVYSENLGKQPAGVFRHSLNLSELPAGVYLLRYTANEEVVTGKVIKR